MKNIDFELYRIFYEVSLAGSITLASERLHVSQPAVSKTIKSLEEQLGGTLFVRTKNGVRLTDEGKVLYENIKVAIEYIRNAEHQFENMVNLETGSIKVGISRTLVNMYLLPFLEEYHKNYPKIKIEIITYRTQELIPKLKEGLIDLIIANSPIQEYADINIIPLKTIQDIFVVSENYPMNTYSLKLKDLKEYPLLLQPKGSNTRDYLDSFLEQNKIILEPEMTLASYGLIEDLARIGYGIGYVVKEFVQSDLKNGKLKEIKTIPNIPSRHIVLMTKNSANHSFATKKLVELLIR